MTEIIVPTPIDEFEHYEKYLGACARFSSTQTEEYNLKFKNLTMVPRVNCEAVKFPILEGYGDQFERVWTWFKGICVDCPPDEKQKSMARLYFTETLQGHYQHWTYNHLETYEQMVGDECYDGINAVPNETEEVK